MHWLDTGWKKQILNHHTYERHSKLFETANATKNVYSVNINFSIPNNYHCWFKCMLLYNRWNSVPVKYYKIWLLNQTWMDTDCVDISLGTPGVVWDGNATAAPGVILFTQGWIWQSLLCSLQTGKSFHYNNNYTCNSNTFYVKSCFEIVLGVLIGVLCFEIVH